MCLLHDGLAREVFFDTWSCAMLVARCTDTLEVKDAPSANCICSCCTKAANEMTLVIGILCIRALNLP